MLRSTASIPALVALALPLVLAIGCTDSDPKDPKDPKDPDPNPDFWLVGDQGNMLGVSSGGEASGYPLELDEDLLAITCLGERTAWVVGTAGTVLRTRDAGQSWDAIALAHEQFPGADWRALSAAEATPEGGEALWFVGSTGAVAHTPDGGRSWITADGATADFTGVATESAGEHAVAVAADGTIWSLDRTTEAGAEASSIHAADTALLGVAMAAHAEDIVVAVGVDGSMLRSDDGGLGWTTVELPTTRDLFAVRVSEDGGIVVAVGEAGVVARIDDGLVEVAELPDAELGLFGLHLRADGRGQAVGGGGILLMTDDAGFSWETLALPTTATLRGVDDFHQGGHF